MTSIHGTLRLQLRIKTNILEIAPLWAILSQQIEDNLVTASESGREKEIHSQQQNQHLNYSCVHAKLPQSCLTLCDPVGCSPPGSSVHGDSPGKNTGVGWHASSRGPSRPWDQTHVSYWQAGSSPLTPPGEPLCLLWGKSASLTFYKIYSWNQLTQVLQGLKHGGKVLVRQEMVQGHCCSVVELVFFSNLPVNTLKSLSNGFSFCTIIFLPPRISSP